MNYNKKKKYEIKEIKRFRSTSFNIQDLSPRIANENIFMYSSIIYTHRDTTRGKKKYKREVKESLHLLQHSSKHT